MRHVLVVQEKNINIVMEKLPKPNINLIKIKVEI